MTDQRAFASSAARCCVLLSAGTSSTCRGSVLTAHPSTQGSETDAVVQSAEVMQLSPSWKVCLWCCAHCVLLPLRAAPDTPHLHACKVMWQTTGQTPLCSVRVPAAVPVGTWSLQEANRACYFVRASTAHPHQLWSSRMAHLPSPPFVRRSNYLMVAQASCPTSAAALQRHQSRNKKPPTTWQCQYTGQRLRM